MLIHDLLDAFTKGLAITVTAIATLYLAGALH